MNKRELEPTSTEDNAIMLGDEFVSQVRSFGVLRYSIERICNILGLTGKERIAMKVRILLPGDAYSIAYHQGLAMGDYNIDSELTKKAESGDTDAISLLKEREGDRVELDLRKELFGV